MKKRIINLTVSLIFLSFTAGICSSTRLADGKLSGYITDKSTGHTIPDANIIIEGTKFGTVSFGGGFYFLEKIPQNTYDITVMVIGYQTVTKKNCTIGSNTTIDFSLEQKPIMFDEIVVTATRSYHLQSKVTQFSDVISAKEIAEKNGNTIGEILHSVGNSFARSYGSLAGIQTVSIRGSSVSQVLVLLDGQRLNTAQGGGVDLSNFPTNSIEKIEILRGGHSALFGSDAVGGLINIITNDSAPQTGRTYGISSTQGSFGMKNYNIYGVQQVGPLYLFLSYNHLENQGDFSFTSPETKKTILRDNNDYSGENVFFKAKLNINSKNKLKFSHQFLRTKRGITGAVTYLTPEARRDETRKLYTLLSENQVSDKLRLEGRLYYNDYRNHYEDSNPFFPADDLHKSFAQGLDLQANYVIFPQVILSSGAEFSAERLSSTKFQEKKRDLQSMYSLLEINHKFIVFNKHSELKIIPALRWDKYSNIDSHISPKFGVLINTGSNLNWGLRGNVGKSFRAPAFFDLYWPADMYTKGNPDLLPEISSNYDIGLLIRRIKASNFQIESVYFQNDFTDLIIWESGSDWIWSPRNVGKAKVTGFENSLFYQLPNNLFQFKITHTRMKAVDNSTQSANSGKRLIYRPDNKLDLFLGFQLKSISTNIYYSIVGRRFTNEDNSKQLPGYRTVNGNIGTTFSFDTITVNAKIQGFNLLNKSIYILDNYPIPGREFRFSLGISY